MKPLLACMVCLIYGAAYSKNAILYVPSADFGQAVDYRPANLGASVILLRSSLPDFDVGSALFLDDVDLSPSPSSLGLSVGSPERMVLRTTDDPEFAYGIRLDLENAVAQIAASRHEWVVVTLYDVARAESYGELSMPGAKAELLRRAWESVRELANHLSEHRTVLLAEHRDAPLAVAFLPGDGTLSSPRLSPSNKRRNGIGLLQELPIWFGESAWTPVRASIDIQSETAKLIATAERRRWGSYLPFVWIGIIALCHGLLWLSTKRPALKPKLRFLPWVAVFAAALSVGSMLPHAVLAAPLFALLVALFGRGLGSATLSLGIAGGLGAMLLLLDSLLDGGFRSEGLLGYSLLHGDRFYGIGNEYASLGLAWTLLFLASWLDIDGLPLTGTIVLFGFALIMAATGANLGGSAATVLTATTYGSMAAYLDRDKPRRAILQIAGVVIAAVLCAYLAWKGAPHVVEFAAGSDQQETVARKLLTNLTVVAPSRWGILLLCALAGIFWTRRTGPLVGRQINLWPVWWVAGGSCLVLNDSGFLMAACIALIAWCRFCGETWSEAIDRASRSNVGFSRL